ncbi:DUF6281 family protein [Streptomyces sp. NPDC002787]
MIGSRVRAALAVLVTTPLAVGCAAVSGGGDSQASCAFVVEYGGRDYRQLANMEFELGAEVGTARTAYCDDTPDDGEAPPEPDDAFEAYAIDGLDTADAIGVRRSLDDETFFMVRQGEELPSAVEDRLPVK